MLEDRFENLKAKYNRRLGEKQSIEKIIEESSKRKEHLENSVIILSKIQLLLETTSNEARQVAIEQIESIVTTALQYIYEEDVKFKIDLTQSRGKPVCEFYVETIVNGEVSRQKPEEATGGGYVDAIATAMRYAYINVFKEPRINNAILLDEPGKMVSEGASVKFAEFIKELGKMFDKQTIVVTHNDNVMNIADKTYTVTKVNDKSIVTEGGFIDYENPF